MTTGSTTKRYDWTIQKGGGTCVPRVEDQNDMIGQCKNWGVNPVSARGAQRPVQCAGHLTGLVQARAHNCFFKSIIHWERRAITSNAER